MKKHQPLRFLLILGFAFFIVYITVLSRTPSLSRVMETSPFRSWQLWMGGDDAAGLGILENVGMFLPFGYLTASFLSSFERRDADDEEGEGGGNALFLTLMVGFLFSLVLEVVQYRTGRGTFEVDDLIHNTFGTFLGLMLFRLSSLLADRLGKVGARIVYIALPAVMLLSGVVGCWQMNRMVAMTNERTSQFWFSVDEVKGDTFSGRCYFYDTETPDYKLTLRCGKEVVKADVRWSGDEYTATAPRKDSGQYQIQVKFKGFVRMDTGVYLNGQKTEYVKGPVEEPKDPEGKPLLPDADLMAYSEKYDCWIYEKDKKLIWLIGPDIPDTTEVICHFYTDQLERLPVERQEHGFDNQGFYAKQAEEMLGQYRTFERFVPRGFHVSSALVGLNPGEETVDVTWKTSFRP